MSDRWYAVRTNPRCEERAVASIKAEGFDVYFPQARKHIVHHRKRVLIEKTYPLLVGYVLAAFSSPAAASHIRGCDGVKGVLGVSGCPLALPVKEVSDIRLAEARMNELFERRKMDLGNKDHGYKVGERVKFKRGPWTDFQATIVDAKSKRAISVMVEVFGRMTEVSAPVDYFERAA